MRGCPLRCLTVSWASDDRIVETLEGGTGNSCTARHPSPFQRLYMLQALRGRANGGAVFSLPFFADEAYL
jgi:hypothetical protein